MDYKQQDSHYKMSVNFAENMMSDSVKTVALSYLLPYFVWIVF